jgi:hypothetical protein
MTIDEFLDEKQNSIQIATIVAQEPGKGAFTNLLLYLTTNFSNRIIYIENALTERFRDYLVRVGFVETNAKHCFWLPTRELQPSPDG